MNFWIGNDPLPPFGTFSENSSVLVTPSVPNDEDGEEDEEDIGCYLLQQFLVLLSTGQCVLRRHLRNFFHFTLLYLYLFYSKFVSIKLVSIINVKLTIQANALQCVLRRHLWIFYSIFLYLYRFFYRIYLNYTCLDYK